MFDTPSNSSYIVSMGPRTQSLVLLFALCAAAIPPAVAATPYLKDQAPDFRFETDTDVDAWAVEGSTGACP